MKCACFLAVVLIGAGRAGAQIHSYCTPTQACWPAAADWQKLGQRLAGRLIVPQSPWLPCQNKGEKEACEASLSNLKNPFFFEDQPGGTESSGWLDAWTAVPSAYAVEAENTADVEAAVKFARDHNLRLVIKGTGHDYLGRSTAPDSLLVWTHKMRRVTMNDSFVGQGCPNTAAGVPAVTMEAGTRWIEAYQEVTVRHGRYVQGGGCTTVGAVGGFIQGGGFGSWSKKFGTAAAGMLEAEVVTADGKVLVANACQNQDLFWALRGGGGGTFGVVTRMTVMTHPLPNSFGWVSGTISAKTDDAFKALIERFLTFYRERLSNEHWGEQVRVNADNTLKLSLAFEGLTIVEARQLWQPFDTWVNSRPEYTMKVGIGTLPGSEMWNYAVLSKSAPDAVRTDSRPGASKDLFFWSDDRGQVSVYWYAYTSRWIPLDKFEETHVKQFSESLFAASRNWPIELHFNKGQAGASADALRRGMETSMNPAVFKAAALAIVAAAGEGLPGVPGRDPNFAWGKTRRERVNASMKIIREATPGAGSYVNEADYFEPDWQSSFWGENYPRLLAIKHKYDPKGFFTCHHCVGSKEPEPTHTAILPSR